MLNFEEMGIYFNIFSAWLKGTDHPIVERVNRRLNLMTNLEMETAEELQVCYFKVEFFGIPFVYTF